MDRTEFFALAAARGYVPGTKLTTAQRTALRNALKNRLDTPDAPRGRSVAEGRDLTSTEAADLLLEELP